jgi:predicted PhzF superfamily epimerase YddE/YHI9
VFCPEVGIPEDPVTGSAHSLLTPFWAGRLRKASLTAWQASRRGGRLFCELRGDRVRIAGRAVLYLRGEICLGGEP